MTTLALLVLLAVPVGLTLLLGAHLRRERWRSDLARVGHLARSSWPVIVGVALLVQLAAWVAPPPLGPAPLEGVAVSRPDWPFLWLVPLQDAFGRYAVYALPALLVAAGFAFTRAPARASPTRRRVVVATALLLFVALTLLGAR